MPFLIPPDFTPRQASGGGFMLTPPILDHFHGFCHQMAPQLPASLFTALGRHPQDRMLCGFIYGCPDTRKPARGGLLGYLVGRGNLKQVGIYLFW